MFALSYYLYTCDILWMHWFGFWPSCWTDLFSGFSQKHLTCVEDGIHDHYKASCDIHAFLILPKVLNIIIQVNYLGAIKVLGLLPQLNTKYFVSNCYWRSCTIRDQREGYVKTRNYNIGSWMKNKIPEPMHEWWLRSYSFG